MTAENKVSSFLPIAVLLDILLSCRGFSILHLASANFQQCQFPLFLTHSLQAFVKDASSFSHEAVDRLLDALTEGAHSKYLKQMAEVIVA